MTDAQERSLVQQMIGDTAPKLADLSDQVLNGDVWLRPELAKRDRSLITIASLITSGAFTQLELHAQVGRDNGLTEEEIVETITHLAFYAGWPKAMSAIAVVQKVFGDK